MGDQEFLEHFQMGKKCMYTCIHTRMYTCGARFLAFQARVRDSADGDAKDGGRLYKEQLERIHALILGFSENR